MVEDEKVGDEGGEADSSGMNRGPRPRRDQNPQGSMAESQRTTLPNLIQTDQDRLPSFADLCEVEELSNGLAIGYYRDNWFVFDSQKRMIRKFRHREEAWEYANSFDPPQPLPCSSGSNPKPLLPQS